jgi:hypothetical protein
MDYVGVHQLTVVPFRTTFTRSDLELQAEPLISKTIRITDEVIQTAIQSMKWKGTWQCFYLIFIDNAR